MFPKPSGLACPEQSVRGLSLSPDEITCRSPRFIRQVFRSLQNGGRVEPRIAYEAQARILPGTVT